jgi:hypothetical protein
MRGVVVPLLAAAQVELGRSCHAALLQRDTRFHPVVASAQIVAAGLDRHREVRDHWVAHEPRGRPCARVEASGEAHELGILRDRRLIDDRLHASRAFGAEADDAAESGDDRRLAPHERAFVGGRFVVRAHPGVGVHHRIIVGGGKTQRTVRRLLAHVCNVDQHAALCEIAQERHARRREALDVAVPAFGRIAIVTERGPRRVVHFPHAEVRAALANLRRSGSTWLLTTHFVGPRPNDEIVLGDWRPLNLVRAPFELPEPVALVDERLTGDAEQWSDKRLALWRLADLAEWEAKAP